MIKQAPIYNYPNNVAMEMTRRDFYHQHYMREFLTWLAPKETSVSAKWTTIVVLTEDYRAIQREVHPEIFEAIDGQH